MLKFYIEFKNPLLKPIYCKEIKAIDLEEAENFFAVQHPGDEIIKIEGRS